MSPIQYVLMALQWKIWSNSAGLLFWLGTNVLTFEATCEILFFANENLYEVILLHAKDSGGKTVLVNEVHMPALPLTVLLE